MFYTYSRNKVKRLFFIIPILAVYSVIFCFIYVSVEALVLGEGHYVWIPHSSAVLEPDSEYIPGVSGRKIWSSNRLGMRGKELKGASIKILALGGSTTEGHYLGDSGIWTNILAITLEGKTGKKVAVQNAAKAGLEAIHYRFQAEQLLPELGHIDYVIILPGPNDIIHFLSAPEGHGVEYKPGDKKVAFERGISINSPWSIQTRKKTYNILKRLTINQTKRLLSSMRLWQPSAVGLVRDPEGRIYRDARARRLPAQKTELPQDKKEILPAELERYYNILDDTVSLIIQHGAVPVIITHPLNYSPSMTEKEKNLWWAGALYGNPQVDENLTYLSEEAMSNLLEEYNEVTRRIYEKYKKDGALLVDLAVEYRGRTNLYYDQWHFNEFGSQEVGNSLKELLYKKEIQ